MLTDRLTVIRRIGTGGMGDVYEVEHKFTRHRRAAKVLHAQFLKNADVVERFLREASAAGRIGNPHIVETFDAGHLADGSPFIVMEFLEGKPIGDVLRWNGRLDPGLASAVMCQVCKGVQAAHDANIIHRDLKPENLFLTERDGRAFVKVLDFGVSKFLSDEEGPEMHTTRSGMTMGTPLYMSPEQLRGAKNADARSDVYSLGVILYEMLSGTAPFVANSFAELAVKVLTAEPAPLHVIDGGLPQQLSQIVAKAIHKDPAARFPSASALGEALAPFASNRSVSVLLQHDVVPASDEPKENSDTHVRPAADSAPGRPLLSDTAAPGSVAAPPPQAPAPSVALGVSELRLVGGGWSRRAVVLVVVGAIGLGAFVALNLGKQGAGAPEPMPAVMAPVVMASPTPVAVAPPLAPPPTEVAKVVPRPEPVTAEPVKSVRKQTTRSTVTTGKGSKVAVEAPLPPPPLPPPDVPPPVRQSGSIDLACVPVSCTVTIDGKAVGETPLLRYKLEVGAHIAVFVNSETKASTSRRFEIKAGEHQRLPISW